jgi:hypothetical protein
MSLLSERNKWIKKRFGKMDEGVLGNVEDVVEITWPDIVREYEVKGNKLTYKLIKDIDASADRIAEIFNNGFYEMVHNTNKEWHLYSEKIVEKVGTGDYNFYGCYLGDELIAAESMAVHRGDRIMEWSSGCVDPVYRGNGVWRYIGLYNDLIVEKSGAHFGFVWVITSHRYSQMAAEKAGYVVMGCAPGMLFYGGVDKRYYRPVIIMYGKLYDAGRKHMQNWESVLLTEQSEKLVSLVRESF